jgi:carnitine 3-dehydrogenase
MSRVAAIIGGGVIGGGWAARFLLNGWDVRVYDLDPEAPRKIGEVLTNARRALPSLYDKAMPVEGQLNYVSSIKDAVTGATWIQESVPERLSIKQSTFAEIQAHASADALIGSSTSGFKPSELQEGAVNPSQIFVAHPFNPVYLLPLVEVVPSAKTSADVAARAQSILTSLGMKPLMVRKEIDAHIADRFLEAVWREGLWLVKDGIATTEEIDDAIRFGFGLRWAQMGLFETYRVAGGEAGMKHFMAQFGPALKWPWTKLMDVPEFTDELVDLIASQSDAQSGHMTIRELERLRDDNLVGIMRSLRKTGSGAGGVIIAHEAAFPPSPAIDLPVTVRRQVPQTWTDYNGHMNETHYLEAGAQATDTFMEMIGADAAYIASGNSYFTVETHIRHLDEVHEGAMIEITTQVLVGEGKKLHLFHRMFGPNGVQIATCETFLLHTDLQTRRSAPPLPHIASRLEAFAKAHASMQRPDGAGRYVGER